MSKNIKMVKRKLFKIIILALIILPSIFFIPAGTINYWEAWVFLGLVLILLFIVFSYFLKNDPEFLRRRLQFREKEKKQKTITKYANLVFWLSMLIPGLDQRFHWSNMPLGVIIAAQVSFFAGYLFVYSVYRVNHYASRVVEVEKGQKLISNGPYALVRHPMYLGVIIMYLSMPLALGSYWALIPFLIMTPISLVLRINDEERVLLKKLSGYKKYTQKVKYRLVPFVW